MQRMMVARVTCPSCSNQIQLPVEQVLDVRANPSAKMRLLRHTVNAGVCPHCRTPVGMNLPFFYHDPEKDLALVLMPLDAGRDNLERQAAIGKITRAVMDSLPVEERRGYLLTPQTFLTVDNMIKKVLDADGVTPEMLAEQRERAMLLQRMIDASSDEVLDTLIVENEPSIDGDFFRLLAMNLNMVQSQEDEANAEKMVALRAKLMDETAEGRILKERAELLEELQEEATREKLVDVLIRATNEGTRRALITVGRRLVDYSFFVALTARIERTADADEQERMKGLRSEILAARDELDKATQAVFQSRSELLRDLMMSKDPPKLARRRFRELDEIFMSVLARNLEEAQKAKNEQAVKALQAIWQLVMHLVEEATPPGLRFLSQLMEAEDEAAIDRLLIQNKQMVDDQMVQVLEQAEASMRADARDEAGAQMKLVLEKVRSFVTRSKIELA